MTNNIIIDLIRTLIGTPVAGYEYLEYLVGVFILALTLKLFFQFFYWVFNLVGYKK